MSAPSRANVALDALPLSREKCPIWVRTPRPLLGTIVSDMGSKRWTRPGPPSVRTHEALQAQQLRLLVDQIPAIVWTVDRNDRFTSALGSGLEPLGGRAGTVDIAMREALADSDALASSVEAHRHALGGRSSRYSASWRGRLYECRVEPLRAGRRIVGSIGVAVDVTNERRAEREALSAYEEGVDCLVRAIESRDIETGQHVARMSLYCSAIAEALGLDSRQCQAIGIAARLHDIGKIGIPDKILLKNAALTREERAIIERHCRAGWEILAGARSEILQLAAVIALTHHEWFDGSGYPQGLGGTDIPLPGRIAAIADVFDALTSQRPYRAVLTDTQARAVMCAERGTHFDPILLDLFMGIDLLAQGDATHATAGALIGVVKTPTQEVPRCRPPTSS